MIELELLILKRLRHQQGTRLPLQLSVVFLPEATPYALKRPLGLLLQLAVIRVVSCQIAASMADLLLATPHYGGRASLG